MATLNTLITPLNHGMGHVVAPLTKAQLKNRKRGERRARKRENEAPTECVAFKPGCSTPSSMPSLIALDSFCTPPRESRASDVALNAPGAPLRNGVRRSPPTARDLNAAFELEELRVRLCDTLASYVTLRDAVSKCASCSSVLEAMHSYSASSASDADEFVVVENPQPTQLMF
jgi:hypothetical protein